MTPNLASKFRRRIKSCRSGSIALSCYK